MRQRLRLCLSAAGSFALFWAVAGVHGAPVALAGSDQCAIQVNVSPSSPIPAGTAVTISGSLVGDVVVDRVTSQVLLDGAQIASPSTLTSLNFSVTIPTLGSGSHTISWSCSATGIGGDGTNAGSVPLAVSGQLLPKFLVLSVIYAPPGMLSFVDYGTSTELGTTSSISDSFSVANSVSVSLTAGTTTIGASRSFTQEQDTNSTVSVKKSSSFDEIAPGPLSSADGINHDFDKFILWLNPVVNVSPGPTGGVTWAGFSNDPRDPVKDMDRAEVFVSELKNPATLPPGVADQLARSWAGPNQGLNATDFATILKTDPFANGPAAIDPTRFQPVGGGSFSYRPPPVGGQPGTQMFSLGYSATNSQTQTATDTLSISFTEGDGASFLEGMLKEENKQTRTLTWVHKVATSSSTTTNQSAKFSLTGPGVGYQGQTVVQAYQDVVYGTFMFAFVDLPTFTFAAAPASQTVSAGASTTYSLTTGSVLGFTGAVTFDSTVAGLPQGVTATFSPGSIPTPGSATLTVATSPSTPVGTYQLTVGATSPIDHRNATVTLVVTPSPAADFGISVTPQAAGVPAGGSATFTVSTTAQNGFSGVVALTAIGLPSGATATFTPSSITGAGTSMLVIATSTSTPVASSTITIQGTSGALSRSAQLTLTVNPGTPPPPPPPPPPGCDGGPSADCIPPPPGGIDP